MLVYCTLISMIYGLILYNHPKINTQKQRAVIVRFAKKNGLSVDNYMAFHENPDLSLFNSGDTILCYAWTCLCSKRSFLRELIPYVLKNNIYLYSATSKYCINPETNIKAFEYAFTLYEDIRFNFLSHKSLEGIQTSIKKGYKPGRQIGSRNKTHVLDGKEKQIIKLYSAGISMNKIAKRLGVSAPTINKFLASKKQTQETSNVKKKQQANK